MINESSQEQMTKGTYDTDKYHYDIQYTYKDSKLTELTIMIKDKKGAYLGNARINSSFTLMLQDPLTIMDHIQIIKNLYDEIVNKITSKS